MHTGLRTEILVLYLEITVVLTIFNSVSLCKIVFDCLLQRSLIIPCFRHGAF